MLVRMQQVDGLGAAVTATAAEPGRRWVAFEQLEAVALPAPVRKLLEALRAGCAGSRAC